MATKEERKQSIIQKKIEVIKKLKSLQKDIRVGIISMKFKKDYTLLFKASANVNEAIKLLEDFVSRADKIKID